MISYQLNISGDYAQKIVDGVGTGEWANIETNEEYLAWLAEGNTPEEAE